MTMQIIHWNSYVISFTYIFLFHRDLIRILTQFSYFNVFAKYNQTNGSATVSTLRAYPTRPGGVGGAGERRIRRRVTLSVVAGVRTANRRRITNTWMREARDPWHWVATHPGVPLYCIRWLRISLFSSHFLSPFTNTRYTTRPRRNAVILYSPMFSPAGSRTDRRTGREWEKARMRLVEFDGKRRDELM